METSSTRGSGVDLKNARKNGSINQNKNSRQLPHDLEMEQGVLGCQLLSPNEAVSELLKRGLVPETHYDLRHQVIQAEIFEMFNGNVPVELATLQQRLKDKQLLERVGGVSYLSKLQDAVPSAANLNYYLDVVMDKFLLRKVVQVGTDMVNGVYEFVGDVGNLLDDTERKVLAIRPRQRNVLQDVKELVGEAIVHIEEVQARKGAIGGLPTGFTDLDAMTDGLHGGEVIIVAGLPGYGKTAFAINIAEHIVLNLGKPVGVFTLEMKAKQLVLRTICSHARVNLRNISRGFISADDYPRMTKSAGALSTAKIYFDDTSDLTVYELRARARNWWQRHGVELIIVDYLQLLSAPSTSKREHRSKQEEIAEISHQLKHMAKEFNIPVIALSQLTEVDGGKLRLRGSADIGQDADNVFRISNVKRKDGDKEQSETEGTPIDLKILKQRNGPTGKVRLMFLKQFTRFENASKVRDEDVPAGS